MRRDGERGMRREGGWFILDRGRARGVTFACDSLY